MKKSKLIIALFSLFSLSLATLGFSAWMIGGPNLSNDVNINFGDVVKGKTLKVNSIETFDLCAFGIVKDETIVDTGEITINISVDIKSALTIGEIDSNGNINIQTSFLCNDITFMQFVKETKISAVGGTCTLNAQISSDRVKIHDLIIPVDKQLPSYSFNLIYLIQGDITPFFENLPSLSFSMETLMK